ncbi:MAG: transcriptional regulator [Alphaproteobacteria bacterium]|nr:transcriptional regulator [Alphaproteobacteria bacterium]MBF0372565.1 transcriptional regulator [Alphaproteobacteria bacterium]
MEIRPIKTVEDHRAALARIDQLMDAQEGSHDAIELELLAILVERYEIEVFPIEAPSPLDAIRFRMEQAGLGQADLARVLGSRSRASEIMNGNVKRLSITQIRRLHSAWRIPAEILIRDVA